jgi:AcrR family transcriptional regulator
LHAASRPPRSQEERSAETRSRLLDATIECLVDVGYARTTTTMVAERAGLSRGAQVHHFPTKGELVLRAVARLAARQAEEMRRRAAGLAGSQDRLEGFLDLLWGAFSGSLFCAVLELQVAARTDPELREPLREFERQAGRAILEMWRELDGARPRGPDSEALLEMTVLMIQGLALRRILNDDDAGRRRLLGLWKRRLLEIHSPLVEESTR